MSITLPATLTATELHALAPFGANIRYSDGTTPPPARHSKKVAAWKKRNGTGYFASVRPQGPQEWEKAGFGLIEIETSYLVAQMHYSTDSTLTFEVERRPAGLILAYDMLGGRHEVQQRFANEAALMAWGAKENYDPANCGNTYWRVNDADELEEYTPPSRPRD